MFFVHILDYFSLMKPQLLAKLSIAVAQPAEFSDLGQSSKFGKTMRYVDNDWGNRIFDSFVVEFKEIFGNKPTRSGQS